MKSNPSELLKPSLALCCTFALTLLVPQAQGATITWNPGQRYFFEVWVNAFWSNSTRTETITVGNSVSLAYNSTRVNGGLGRFAIGTFTADNSGSQSISFGPVALPGASPASQINGFQ